MTTNQISVTNNGQYRTNLTYTKTKVRESKSNQNKIETDSREFETKKKYPQK